MKEKERAQLEELHAMTSTEGWKLIVEETTTKVEQLKDQLSYQDFDERGLGFVQGRINVYRELSTLREQLKFALDNFEANEE